ncbi:MAG: SDR family oxidoreductase [Thermoleophilaceae bacterium]|nr:SDR family oxidoreductase [Thermoleophilaceae bacterium]
MSEQKARTVVVTGAARGIGRAVALRFARAGANVVAADVEGLDDTEAAATELSGACLGVLADVRERAQVESMLATAEERFGPVGVLVCNAAVGFPDPFLEITPERWQDVVSVNLGGAFVSCQAALPAMIERGEGSIVIMSSIAGRRASVTNGAHYTCSKYALIGLTRHLAIELGGTGVRVNSVAPGPIETRLLTDHTSDDERARIAARMPLGRIGSPDDVAEVVFFVASPSARQIHGAVLDVNGGMH